MLFHSSTESISIFFSFRKKMGKYKTKYAGVHEKIDANNVKIASPPVFRIISPIYLPYFSKEIMKNPIFISQIIPYFTYFLLIVQWGTCMCKEEFGLISLGTQPGIMVSKAPWVRPWREVVLMCILYVAQKLFRTGWRLDRALHHLVIVKTRSGLVCSGKLFLFSDIWNNIF